MQLADVNVFVAAHREEIPHSKEYRGWLATALLDEEPFGVSTLVLSAFVRIVTNHRVFREPSPTELALSFCDRVLSARSAVAIQPGPRHWAIFDQLCADVGARANTVSDAYLAALAIENGATWISSDRGFARFPGLRWRTPLEH